MSSLRLAFPTILALLTIAAASLPTANTAVAAMGRAPVQEGQINAQENVAEIVKTLTDSRDKYARAEAAAKLANYPEQYEQYVYVLAELLVDRDRVLNDIATRIFSRLGKKGVAALNPDFTGDPEKTRLVCSAIHAIGDGCEEYIPDLLKILKTSDDRFQRVAATYALTGFTQGNPEAIDLILSDLDNSDMNVTLFAMRLIIKTGPNAKQAAPKLIELFENGVPSQRGYAIWSLAAVSPVENFDAVAATQKMLNRFTVSERERGLIAAGLLGEAAQPAVEKVKEMMAGKNTNIEGHAAVTYWQITGDADTAIQRLIELTENDLYYEINGLKLIAQMGPAAEPAIELLLRKSQAGDSTVQLLALDALKAIGPAAAKHREAIEKIKDSTRDDLVQLAATEILESFELPNSQ